MKTANGEGPRSPSVAIIGAGVSGLCLATRLKEAGFHNFTIFEKADAVGGTWRDNRYPGLSCDIPARYYQFTFAPNPDWTRFRAPGHEIRSYLEGIADRYELGPHLRFGSEIVSADFDRPRWRLRTKDGEEVVVDFVVTACGFLHHPFIPEIEGMNAFEGAMFHSTRWDESMELNGKRIAVIGTGSTGVQIVETVADTAGTLLHFQRSPQWVFPMPDWAFSRLTRWMLRRVPRFNHVGYRVYQRAISKLLGAAALKKGWARSYVRTVCRLHLRTVRDPELRRALTPDWQPMCKRLVMSTKFYRAVQRDNVRVVSDRIERFEPTGIRTADGRLHELDIIVLATGFHAQAYIQPMQVIGEDGRTLEELWAEEPTAYRTIGLPGIPNFFMMIGPHSPIGTLSIPEGAEAQSGYILQWLQLYRDGVYDTAAPSEEATKAFNEEIRAAYPGENIWATGGCTSWYIGKYRQPNLWPWTNERYTDMLREPQLDEFELTRERVLTHE